jgi:plasmid stabilization system protein ParE
MTLAVTFSRTARDEFLEAAAWYESQRPNLGVEFIAEIERCLALAAEQPQMHAMVYKNTRRVTARRFPYSIYFQVESCRIVVLAVFHGSRHPTIWRARVERQ